MTDSQAKRYIVGAMTATAVLSSARDLTGGRIPRLRIFVAVIAAGAVLAMLSEAAPDFAGMFALLILTSAVFMAGAPTFDAMRQWLQHGGGSKDSETTTTTARPTSAPAQPGHAQLI